MKIGPFHVQYNHCKNGMARASNAVSEREGAEKERDGREATRRGGGGRGGERKGFVMARHQFHRNTAGIDTYILGLLEAQVMMPLEFLIVSVSLFPLSSPLSPLVAFQRFVLIKRSEDEEGRRGEGK